MHLWARWSLTLQAARQGWMRMYFDIPQYSWSWFITSILLTILLHDTYFYWTHRWMHRPAIFKWMHRIHHQSNNPSPWAAFAFSPWAAFAFSPWAAFALQSMGGFGSGGDFSTHRCADANPPTCLWCLHELAAAQLHLGACRL